MSIFKQQSCETELFKGMQHAQDKVIIKEASAEENLIILAMQELNAAAKSFEQYGSSTRAEEVTNVIISLTNNGTEEFMPKEATSEDEAKNVFAFLGLTSED